MSPDRDFRTSCLLCCGHLTVSANSKDSWKRICFSRTMGCGALWLLLLGAGYKYSYLLTYLLHITIYLFQTRKVLTTHKHTHKNTETIEKLLIQGGGRERCLCQASYSILGLMWPWMLTFWPQRWSYHTIDPLTTLTPWPLVPDGIEIGSFVSKISCSHFGNRTVLTVCPLLCSRP